MSRRTDVQFVLRGLYPVGIALLLVKVDMFLAAVRVVIGYQNGGFRNMHAAVLALAHIFRAGRFGRFGFRCAAEQAF